MEKKNQKKFSLKIWAQGPNTWVFAVVEEGVMNVESLYLQK